MTRQKKHIAIDLFSGAGGLSLGAINAGIDVAVSIEYDKVSAKTYKRNHPNTIVINDDIRKIDIASLKIQSPFIIFGGPPCQGFSTSNTQTRNLDNSNNSLFREFVRFVKELSPVWFLFENVEGIVSFNKGDTLKEICKCFENLGYKVAPKVVCASDYGVPQNRNRFIMVGNKIDVNFEFPQPFDTKISVSEAIEDLPDLQNGDLVNKATYIQCKISEYAKRMRLNSEYATQNFVSRNSPLVIERYSYIGIGQNWKAIPPHLMSNYKNKENCHSGIYKRLDPNKPSVVISNYRKNMLIHPYANRGLSVREAARLQSFPDDFIFEGSIHYIQQQIGNAVPPLLGEAIFKQIIKMNNSAYGL